MSTITRIQFRGDIAANWTSVNPVLAEREFAIETDTNKYKIGNGILTWSALPYSSIDVVLSAGTNVTITNDYEIALDDNVNVTSLSASTIYSGSTNLYDIFAVPSDIPSVPTRYDYDFMAAASDETTAITTGSSKVTFLAPSNFTLTGATASLTTTGSTSTVVDVNYNGSTIFTSPITLASGVYYNTSATTTSTIVQYGKFTVDIDTAGTGAAGLKVALLGYKSL